MGTPDTYNRGGYIALIGSIVFSLGFFAYIVYGYKGIDLKEVTEAESPAAGPALAGGDAAGPAFDPSKIEKPWNSSPELVAHGKVIYQNNCAVCHGAEGKGDGPAGASLQPPPRNFVEGKWKKGGDSIAIYEVIRVGIDGSSMASFASIPKMDRWSLVHFIRSITQNKVPDTPAKLDKFGPTAQ